MYVCVCRCVGLGMCGSDSMYVHSCSVTADTITVDYVFIFCVTSQTTMVTP